MLMSLEPVFIFASRDALRSVSPLKGVATMTQSETVLAMNMKIHYHDIVQMPAHLEAVSKATYHKNMDSLLANDSKCMSIWIVGNHCQIAVCVDKCIGIQCTCGNANIFQSIQELSTAMLLLHVQNPSPMPQSGSSSQRQMHRHPVYVRQCVTKRIGGMLR
jgi:hypothetical protein